MPKDRDPPCRVCSVLDVVVIGTPALAATVLAWYMLGATWYAFAVQYAVFGAVCAATLVDWSAKTYMTRRLPRTRCTGDTQAPNGVNVAIATVLLFGVVVLCWPLYVRIWTIERRGRPKDND